MDTVSHGLIGTAISDGIFRRKLGTVATPFSFIVGSLPDVDMLFPLFFNQSVWSDHRGYTHAFFIQALASPILGYIGYRCSKRCGTWLQWTLLTALCLVCHTFFDLITNWGTMALLPFSSARLALDIAPWFDAVIFIVSAISFTANRVFFRRAGHTRLLGTTAGAGDVRTGKPTSGVRNGALLARIALLCLGSYLCAGYFLNRTLSTSAMEQLQHESFHPVVIRSAPVMLTILGWEVVAQDAAGDFRVATYSILSPKSLVFDAYPSRKGSEVDTALSTPPGEMFLRFCQGFFDARIAASGTGTRVRLLDRRFFWANDAHSEGIAMDIELGAEGDVVSVTKKRPGIKAFGSNGMLSRIWQITCHGDYRQ